MASISRTESGRKSLQARAPQRDAVGFQRQVGVVAMHRIGGHGDFVIDLVGRFHHARRGEAFGQTQARARRDFRRRIGGGDGVLLRRSQARGIVEERRGFRLFHGDARPARGDRPPCCAGIGRRARSVLSSHSKSIGLPPARYGPTGWRSNCRIASPASGRGKFHGQNSVLVFDGIQLRGGVDDALHARRSWSIRGTAPWAQRDAHRQPERFARRHRHGWNRRSRVS